MDLREPHGKVEIRIIYKLLYYCHTRKIQHILYVPFLKYNSVTRGPAVCIGNKRVAQLKTKCGVDWERENRNEGRHINAIRLTLWQDLFRKYSFDFVCCVAVRKFIDTSTECTNNKNYSSDCKYFLFIYFAVKIIVMMPFRAIIAKIAQWRNSSIFQWKHSK